MFCCCAIFNENLISDLAEWSSPLTKVHQLLVRGWTWKINSDVWSDQSFTWSLQGVKKYAVWCSFRRVTLG